jgi:hypothetical protein
MPTTYINWLFKAILLFHFGVTIHGFYSFYYPVIVPNIYAFLPLLYLAFTAVWFGIVLKKRWCVFLYVSLIFYELAMKLFFGKYMFGKVFGEVFFPVDILFVFIALLLYKQFFNQDNQHA